MPTHDEYKAAINEIFPHLTGKIALIPHDCTGYDMREIFNAVARQTDIDKAAIRYTRAFTQKELFRLRIERTWATKHFKPALNFLNPRADHDASRSWFFKIFDTQLNIVGGFIILPSDRYNVRRAFSVAAGNLNQPVSATLNLTNADRKTLNWFIFFHELCHARMSVNRPLPHMPQASRVFRINEEGLCDAFAALMLLKKSGTAALPVIEDFAAVRDIHFKSFSAHDHKDNLYLYNAQILKSIITDHKSGRLEKLDKLSTLDSDAIMLLARKHLGRGYDAYRRAHPPQKPVI